MRGLSKRFGVNEILKNLSFEVADGEFCILLGPSGCGKSTVLRLIAGLERPGGGEIVIDGRRVDHLQPRERDIAFVFQNYALYPHMTVFDNLAFSLRLSGATAAETKTKVTDAARLLEIENLLDRRPQALSGGQKQRVALGRAIVRQPRIFLFDEPLSNLDASLRAAMRVELVRLHRRLKATILYVTHDQAEALTLGEKIIVLHQGSIQQIGSPAEIYRKPTNTFVASFVGSPRMNFLEGRLADDGSVLLCGALRVVLPINLGRSLSRSVGSSITLGARAEDLRPTDAAQAWLRGVVELVEDLGSDRYVHLKCDNAVIVARASGEITIAPGDLVGLDVLSNRLHFFKDGSRFEP